MRDIILLIIKDIKIQFRSHELLFEMIVLGLLLILITGLAFGPEFSEPENMAAGSIWIALSFVTVINSSRSFLIEREGDCLKALLLTGIDPGKLFLSKFLSSFLLINMAAIIIVPASLIAFKMMQLCFLLPLMIVVLLGTIGYGSVGVILAAMNNSPKSGENFLAVILFPIIMPLIIFAVKASKILFANGCLTKATNAIVFLLIYDFVFIIISYLLFDRIIED